MIKRASQFTVPQSWKVLLNDMDIDPQLVLAYAKLPADLFNREKRQHLTQMSTFSFGSELNKRLVSARCRCSLLNICRLRGLTPQFLPLFAVRT